MEYVRRKVNSYDEAKAMLFKIRDSMIEEALQKVLAKHGFARIKDITTKDADPTNPEWKEVYYLGDKEVFTFVIAYNDGVFTPRIEWSIDEPQP